LPPPDSALGQIASAHAVRPAQIALAWLLTRSPTIVPLPGTTNPDWFAEDLAALNLNLPAAQLTRLQSGALAQPPAAEASRSPAA
jgi:pyridoxine 4-dehydrogenase